MSCPNLDSSRLCPAGFDSGGESRNCAFRTTAIRGRNSVTIAQRGQALSQRWKTLFRDHEIYVRTGGDVRFLRLSATLQQRAAVALIAVVSIWLAITLYMVGARLYDRWYQSDVATRAVAVERAEQRVAANRDQIARQVEALNARQSFVENIVHEMATADTAAAAANVHPASTQPAAAGAPSAGGDEISLLNAVSTRQMQLAAQLTARANARAAQAEAALANVGIRANSAANQGGPFIPAGRFDAAPRDPAFQRLAAAFNRMQRVELIVQSIPTTIPAAGMDVSSGFGVRHDPFNGAAAMHAGLDFVGAHGSPIYAAADGRVAFVGVRNGYGNVVEIDHGHGIMTRYAHLSGFVAREGQAVTAGDQIARMGSTGRSTGTHLHFEVRVGGTAVNPRRFLEANPDVLKVQTRLAQRAIQPAAR